MKETWILGVDISNRLASVAEVQNILAKFGCTIRTRLGLHNSGEQSCPGCGLILLELCGNPEECSKLESELGKVQGTVVKKMVFTRE
jgi:hypothetical protein